MEPSVEEPLIISVKIRRNVIILGGVFALLCVTSWHVITIDQKQQEKELLLHAGVKTFKSSNHKKKPNTSTTTTTAVASEPILDTKDTWPEISNRLCPNMKPKSQLARTIFYLARQELKKGSASITNSSNYNASSDTLDCNYVMSDRLPKLFFFFGPGTYSTASDHGSNNKSSFFTYFPIWKCANNQLRGFWEQVFGGLSRHNRIRRSINPQVEECIVMAVRDPISHFISGYNEIESRIVAFRSTRERTAKTWPFSRFQAGSSERFQQLITDILDCPTGRHYRGILDPYPATLELQHLYSMTGVLNRLLAKNMTRDLHYLPSLEDLEHSWPQFIVESCPGSFSNATATRILTTEMNISRGTHESSKDLLGTYAAAKRVWSEGGVFAKALCALHILDYACWKDLPEGVPKLCLDLYVSYSVDGHF
jgi:hypothetical protein